jgi:hypothetical protein
LHRFKRPPNRLALFAPILFCAVLYAQAGSSPFATHAHFSADNADDEGKCCVPAHLSSALVSVVATIEPPSGPMRYSWLQLDFYSFVFTKLDIEAARKGDRKGIETRWEAANANFNPYTDADLAAAKHGDRSAVDRKAKQVAAHVKAHNEGSATLQLAVDSSRVVRQVNLTMPGYGCTVAIRDQDLKNFLQEYQFDGKKLRLRSKGSFACDMKSTGGGTPKFSWDLDLNTPVFSLAPGE